MRLLNAWKIRFSLPILSVLFVIAFTSCLFSPTKSGDDFALSSRVWDGISIDSAGQIQSLDGWLRLHFDAEGEVKVQVGLRKGEAPFAVRSSGRMSLGFEDEPLTLGSGELIFSPATEALVAAFLAKVDRYKQDKDKLYLRTSAYPDIMITLKASDTSVAIAVKPEPVKPVEPVKPKPPVPETTAVDSPDTATEIDQKELLRKLAANSWNGQWVNASSSHLIRADGLLELWFTENGAFRMNLGCAELNGNFVFRYQSSGTPFSMVFGLNSNADWSCLENATGDLAALVKVVRPMFNRPFIPTFPNGRLELSSDPMLSSIPYTHLSFTPGKVLIDPPIIRPLDTLYILPTDFPVYGGRRVPFNRVELYRSTIEAWDKWKQVVASEAAAGYFFEFSEACFCTANRNGRITVRDGQPTEFVPASPSISPQPALEDLPTVEKLFAQIGLLLTREYREGESMRLNFGNYGEPIFLAADPIPGQTQDDLSFKTSRLTPLKPIVVFPTLTLEQLVRFGWVLHSLQENAVLAEIARKVAVQFGSDGTWSGTFGCNTYGGTLKQQADGTYAFTLDYQTFFECGDGAVTEVLEALLKNPVIVQRAGERMLSIQSVDGLIQALFGADQ